MVAEARLLARTHPELVLTGIHLGHYGLDLDPEREVLVTAGATEAIAAAILALVDPGDEVVLLEPSYDAYPAVVAMAGGVVLATLLLNATTVGALVRRRWKSTQSRVARYFFSVFGGAALFIELAGPGGLAAAIRCAREGRSVLVTTWTGHLGGLVVGAVGSHVSSSISGQSPTNSTS